MVETASAGVKKAAEKRSRVSRELAGLAFTNPGVKAAVPSSRAIPNLPAAAVPNIPSLPALTSDAAAAGSKAQQVSPVAHVACVLALRIVV